MMRNLNHKRCYPGELEYWGTFKIKRAPGFKIKSSHRTFETTRLILEELFNVLNTVQMCKDRSQLDVLIYNCATSLWSKSDILSQKPSLSLLVCLSVACLFASVSQTWPPILQSKDNCPHLPSTAIVGRLCSAVAWLQRVTHANKDWAVL